LHLNTIKKIHNEQCSLGEGVFFSSKNQRLYWLDINLKNLFISTLDNQVTQFYLPEMAGVIVDVYEEKIFLASESGICCFDTKKEFWTVLFKSPYQPEHYLYRANDGCKLSDNCFIFGRMKKKPEKGQGDIIIINKGVANVIYEGITIPNTFIPLPDENAILISDSLQQKVFKFFLNIDFSIKSTEVWLDLSDYEATPDGGCISSNKDIYLTLWDGHAILKFNIAGDMTGKIELPFPRPTNCVLNEDESLLYITSATEGLTQKELEQYPLSGHTIAIPISPP